MWAVNLLEESGLGGGSIWVPVLVLGWFLIMTIVGWQASRRNGTAAAGPDSPSEHDLPAEFDNH